MWAIKTNPAVLTNSNEGCSDRRDAHRVRLRVPASIRIGSGPWCDAGLAQDVSASGARLEIPRQLAEDYESGDPVAIELRMPACDGNWPSEWTTGGDAVLVRVDDSSASADHDSLEVAARFVDRIRFRF
jgi:hypothetical protein